MVALTARARHDQPAQELVDPAESVVRSAFRVTDASEDVLRFDEFVFLNGDATEGLQTRLPRGYRALDRDQVDMLLEELAARDAYTRYDAGDKPESIPERQWKTLLEKTGRRSSSSGCTAQPRDAGCGSTEGCD